MSKSYSLFLDTTQDFCNIAILKDGKIQSFLSIPTHKNMTDIVVKHIKEELDKNKVKLENLQSLYLLIGPGSFTGCRVGYIVITTFANLLNIPIYYLNSLVFQTKDGNGVCIIDAKSNKKYFAVYKNYKSIVIPQLVLSSDVDKLIKKYHDVPVYIDYKDVNVKKNLLKHLKHFVKCDEIDKLEPLYIKDPV